MASTDIPKTQKSLVYLEHGGKIEIQTTPIPKPDSNELLVKIEYSGICHSDVHAWVGDWNMPGKELPLIGGHEGTGIVVAKGSNVDDEDFKIGDSAGIKWLNKTCLSCEFCNKGEETVCPKQAITGYTMDGTYRQYAIVNASQAVKIPHDVNKAELAPVLCAGLTTYRGLKETGCLPGEWVAIPGAGGGLGAFAIQYAKVIGLRPIAIDGGEEKGKFCKSLGAEVYIDFTKEDVIKRIYEVTGCGAHGILNVSSSAKTLEYLGDICRPSGTIVLCGVPGKGAANPMPVLTYVGKKLTVKGSPVGNRADSQQAIGLFIRGLIKSPVKIVGLNDVPKIFNMMRQGKAVGRYVVDMSKLGSVLDFIPSKL